MQTALALPVEAPPPEAHRLACEARDWVRRGVVPGSVKWGATMKLVRDRRGDRSARELEDAICAWHATRDAWLPDLERRLAPYLAPTPDATEPPAAASDRHSSSRPGSFLSRIRHNPA